jgi:hypothetical protein
MEPWMAPCVCSQLRRGGSKKSRGVSVDQEVANSDRYDEEKDPDYSEKSDPDSQPPN